MIPLRIRAEGAQGSAPFVVRLIGAADSDRSVTGPWDLVQSSADSTSTLYEGRQGRLRLSGIPACELTGDVLLVDPAHNIAHRLIRARSPHNSFLVTEQCDQLCAMCSQPPKKGHTDLFPEFLEAALLAPLGMTIGITGGEPTLYKADLFELLDRALHARPDLNFHVLTNAQHFEESDTDRLAALPAGKVLWGVPLYADDAALHDEIVGKRGAFVRLMRSLALLARCGAAIELRTVLVKTNALGLASLARFVATHLPFAHFWAIMQLENIGYGRMNWGTLFFDSGATFAPVAAAIDTAQARGLSVALYNFPLCTVPIPYRQYAHASISDWKRRYLKSCESCRVRESCGGFFAWYPEDAGFAQVGPL
jgi:His-Xaa-Ser system radical SAM maturase HxsC